VSSWTDIVQVVAGGRHTVGLKSDGTVVAVGVNQFCQCNLLDWNLWSDIVVLEITIDIKPKNSTNIINPNSSGQIPVAILSNFDFDAPAEVDTESLTFGATGDEASLASCNLMPKDVNDDGYDDLVCRFYTQMTEFACGDDEGILKGRTVDETPFEGSDFIQIPSGACP